MANEIPIVKQSVVKEKGDREAQRMVDMKEYTTYQSKIDMRLCNMMDRIDHCM